MKIGARRLGLTALALATLALATLSLSAALRDVEPPRLYHEADDRVPAGASVDLFVSADEPVTYTVTYADTELVEVAQDHVFVLTAVPGVEIAQVTAVDAAGNSTVAYVAIEGVESVELTVTAPDSLRSGDPLGIVVSVAPNGATVVSMAAETGGDAVPLMTTGQDARGVLATPLVVEPTTVEVVVTVVDEFGRSVTVTRVVAVEPLPVVVEQLRIAPSVLAVVTPEGQALERRAVEDALAAGDPQPRWAEPFMAPIEGRETSGFADARRYAEGGPVSFHNGLDIAAPTGTPVMATNAGRVLIADDYPIKGGWVMIDHGFGLYSHYFHLSSVGVEAGQLVERGQFVGEVGSTGLSTGPHLHWEMRLGTAPTNPLRWVGTSWP